MNKFIKFCCVAMLLVLVLPITSCKQTNQNNNEPEDKTEKWDEELLISDDIDAVYEYYFESVEKLLYAIKHEPDKYNNASIKVIGTIQTGLESTLYDIRLVDYTITSNYIPNTDGVAGRYEFRNELDKSAYKIDIAITNDAQYAVAETGDYVKIYGTIRITRDYIFVGNCEYDLIATIDERIQNLENVE